MKKCIAITICLMLIFSLAGCREKSVEEDVADTAYNLTAVITEINGTTMLIRFPSST